MYAGAHKHGILMPMEPVGAKSRTFSDGPIHVGIAHTVVVVAASAGSLHPIIELVSALPSDFPASVVIAQHLPPAVLYESQLREILCRYTSLPVKWIEHGEQLQTGTVYLSPQDAQTRVTSDLIFDVTIGVRESGSRPAADPLFESVAEWFGENALAIILTGCLSDGARGSLKIADAGGRVFVQDEETALFFDMPRAAIRKGIVDFAFPPSGIAHALITLLMAPGASAWFRVTRPSST
jgi:two-component system chemotaxis response regulator CheB